MEAMHKIKVTIGSNSFEAEGPEDLVTAQYNAFLEAISSQPKRIVEEFTPPKGALSVDLTPEELAHVFLIEADGISLIRKPRTENPKADGVLVLLYGYQKLRDEKVVGAAALLNAAKASGLGLDRLDKIVKERSAFIQASGLRRGVRYTLTTPGVMEARKLVRALIDE